MISIDRAERRQAFQAVIEAAIRRHLRVAKIERRVLRADRTHSIGGAYPRYVWSTGAAIAVDEAETSSTIDGLLRSAILWQDRVRRPLYVITPALNTASLVPRLRALRRVRDRLRWLQWDGHTLDRLNVPDLDETTLGDSWVQTYSNSTHRSFRENILEDTHESFLQSLLIRDIQQVIPGIRPDCMYPQVPSFVQGRRDILDLLTITYMGRLVIVEVKAATDPELPFQALDYWLAVERHHRLGEFQQRGYFPGLTVRAEPPVLITVAPILAYHRTFSRLISELPATIPLCVLGVSHGWRQGIKVLRRTGGSVRL